MFKNKVFLVIMILGIIGIMFYSLSGSESYTDTVKKQRDTFLKNLMSEDDSPIASLKDFSGIKYFDADKKFTIDADFKAESAGQGMILMTDSTQTEIKKAGTATFSVNGKTFTVSLFDEGEHFLFPFRDLTSGKETYGGGRFINIPKDNLKGDKIEIDFNNSHNFYCAYNESFICPIPPKENFIDAEIRAGEKKYKE
ncbi:hypothetical protein GCM10011514_00050 [Emticicia aquatilis]|uniref:DUF1684 domain-containing protein n=1 Tax=Emticicia aquatilis TaxID=1537369 RepID=A0A916YC95_9BACT|nr:DUF1684 domain-containing protein [Emticicia aquatilis]GGD39955.1 hypothetical protein GCM10011514_00050 [Emticicia aquatilis]